MTPATATAGVLLDAAVRVAGLAAGAPTPTDRARLLRAGRQLYLVAQQVGDGTRDVAFGQAWLDAARLFVFEWEVQSWRLTSTR